MSSLTVLIMAKAPIPGRVKTRLRPAFTDDEASELAAAALTDTVAAAFRCTDRVVVALERWGSRAVPAEIGDAAVIDQQGGGLGERLDNALARQWEVSPGRQLVIGMDTPQVTPELLLAVADLAEHPPECGIGLASDGGFWALAFAGPPVPVLSKVPMSRPETGALTVSALRSAGCQVREGPQLADVDDATAAARVASIAPATVFARTYCEIVARRS